MGTLHLMAWFADELILTQTIFVVNNIWKCKYCYFNLGNKWSLDHSNIVFIIIRGQSGHDNVSAGHNIRLSEIVIDMYAYWSIKLAISCCKQNVRSVHCALYLYSRRTYCLSWRTCVVIPGEHSIIAEEVYTASTKTSLSQLLTSSSSFQQLIYFHSSNISCYRFPAKHYLFQRNTTSFQLHISINPFLRLYNCYLFTE